VKIKLDENIGSRGSELLAERANPGRVRIHLKGD